MTPQGKVTVKEGGLIEVTRADPTINGPGKGITLGAPGTLNITATATAPVTAALELKIEENGTVKLSDGSSLVLEASTTTAGGAKLTGLGKLVAGATEIVGGPETAGWQAVFTDGSTATVPDIATENITIKAGPATDPNKTIIQANVADTSNDAASFNAVGPGATIAQRALEGNLLTIAASTKIALEENTSGTPASPDMGSLMLLGDTTNPGEIKLLGTKGVDAASVTAGSGGTGVSVKKIGGVEFQPGNGGLAVISADTGSIFTEMAAGNTSGVGLKGGNDNKKTITINASAQVSN
jgi:hypothetical protein